jgi:hypothetical protein
MESGDRNVYADLLSREEWCDIIAKKLEASDFYLLETNIGPLSEDQMGFMGDHLKLQATVLHSEGNQEQKLEFFAKSVPMKNKVFQEYVETIQAFKKEVGFFSNLLPDLKKCIIKSKRTLEDDNSSAHFWTCECYLSKPDIIVLEDLVALGFQHTDSRSPMDYDHCILMLQTLARYHAASVIFEERRPKISTSGQACQIIDAYPDIFFETEWVATEGHPGNRFMKASVKGMISMLEHLPNYGQNYENFDVICKKLPQTLEKMCEFVKPSTKFRNVVCHGDLWVNNIFFRYNDSNKPIEARFVDFQLIRYNPPASEVMWFLHLVTRRHFRESNMDVFLTTYYQSFSSELLSHHLDADLLVPWNEFTESCNFYQDAGRMAAALYFQQCMMTGEYLKMIFSDPNHMTMFQLTDKSQYLIECYQNDPIFRERNTEVLEEMIEYCILNK